VIDVALVTRLAVEALEDHGGVGVIPVVVLEDDPDPRVVGQVRAAEAVDRIRRLGQ
jgi:hypothetical protein